MTYKVGINGFGRIGRLVLRAFLEARSRDKGAYPGMEIVAINDVGSWEESALLFKYDSIHGTYPGDVTIEQDVLRIEDTEVKVLDEKDPSKLPWGDLGVDLVLECSGFFTHREKAYLHCGSGAKKVLISAPAQDADATVVFGVNDHTLTPKDFIVSNASCTTNALVPVAYILDKAYGIVQGHMTTIHAYTGDQRLVDGFHKDPQRARAAALSIVPSATGAARSVGLVLPHLKGRLDGMALRVPVPNVSVVDLTCLMERPPEGEAIKELMKLAAKEGRLRGVLEINELPLVSVDFNHSRASSIIDLSQTKVMGSLCRVLAWYDNEWGFSNRMLDTAAKMSEVG